MAGAANWATRGLAGRSQGGARGAGRGPPRSAPEHLHALYPRAGPRRRRDAPLTPSFWCLLHFRLSRAPRNVRRLGVGSASLGTCLV